MPSCQKDIDKHRRPMTRSDKTTSGPSLFAIPTSILFENRKRKVLKFLEHLHNMPGNGNKCSSLNEGEGVKCSPFKNQHFQKDLSGKRFVFVGPDLGTNLMYRAA